MPDISREYHALRPMLHHARRHPQQWLLPTLLIGGLSLAYAVVHRPDWQPVRR
jgi:hypothetical protein